MNKLTKSGLNLSEWEFEFQQRHRDCILLNEFLARGLYEHFPEELGFDAPRYDYLFSHSNHGYVKTAQKKAVLDGLWKAIGDERYLENLIRNSVSRMQDYAKVARSVADEANRSRSSEALGVLWDRFTKSFLSVTPWFFIPWYVSEYNMLTDRVKDGLERHRDDIANIADSTDALLVLIFPTKRAAFQKEQEDFFELALFAQSHKDFEQSEIFRLKARAHLEKYDWLTTYFVLPLARLSEEQLLQKVRSALADGSLEDFSRQRVRHEKETTQAEALLRVLAADSQLCRDVESARELGYALTAGIEIAMEASALLLPFFELVASRIGLEKTELQHATPAEISDTLHDRSVLESEEIKRRGDAFVLAILDGKTRITSGAAARELGQWIDAGINKAVGDMKEFRGQSASRGKATGKVKIAPTPHDSYELKDGEILVCSMTGPDYVPAMRRAAAIVTVEGGLLSHAAIMSREFGKPCIVGTKVATQVLKDGDLVEVDAERGIVMIISTAKAEKRSSMTTRLSRSRS